LITVDELTSHPRVQETKCIGSQKVVSANLLLLVGCLSFLADIIPRKTWLTLTPKASRFQVNAGIRRI
jgi:hypothetical protein